MRTARASGAALLLSLTTPLAAEPVSSSRGPILQGELAPEADRIVAIVNVAGGLCTGAPITPNLILTARHCIGDTLQETSAVSCDETVFLEPDSAGAMFVLTTPEITNDPADYRAVRAVRSVPGDDASLCGRDLALLVLAEPLSVEPLVPRVDAAVQAGETYSVFGYGEAVPGQSATAGQRRTLGGLSVRCVGEQCNDSDVRPTEWSGTNEVCSGDSGGPALDADGRVIGVVSRGFGDCSRPIYGSVFEFRDWLAAEAVSAARSGRYEAPGWALGYSTDARYQHPIGDRCSADEACASGYCRAGACTRECNDLAPCPADYTCASATSLCERQDDELDSSCALRPPPRNGSVLATAALGIVLASRARRRGRAQLSAKR